MQYVRYKGISAGDGSGNINGSPIAGDQLFALSVQGVISAASSPVGTLKIQVSNDQGLPGAGVNGTPTITNWSDLSGASVAVSASGAVLIPKTDLCYRWFRVVYSFTSGNCTVNANVMALGI